MVEDSRNSLTDLSIVLVWNTMNTDVLSLFYVLSTVS